MSQTSRCDSDALLGHLQAAVEEVFETMLNTMITRLEPPAGDAARVQFESRVEFSGPQNGEVVLQCSAEGALDIARGLLMLDSGSSVPLCEVQDAIGECANMVTGSLKTRALDPHGSFSLGVPRFGAGGERPGARRTSALRFRISQGCAAIEIWLEEPAA